MANRSSVFAISVFPASIIRMKTRLVIPWKGTMSLDPTIRQKLVRVISSAAVCGLSFSFIIGEAVDLKAKEIGQWKVDPTYFPSNYLPARPLAKSLGIFSTESVTQSIVAVNSGAGAPPEAPVMPAFQDSLRTILAAPVTIPPPAKEPAVKLAPVAAAPLPAPAPTTANAIMPVAMAEKLESRDVERVLLSIHDATSQLHRTRKPEGAIASNGVAVKSLAVPAPAPETPKLGPNEEVILGDTGNEAVAVSKPKRVVSEETTKEPELAAAATEWQIRGRISEHGKPASGHFEVSLFAKIDQDGNPVGYPLVQQILPAGKLDFQLKVPAKVARGFLYGEFIAAKGGKRSWIAPPMNPWVRGDRQFAELAFAPEDTISSVASSHAPAAQDGFRVTGSVFTLFSQESNQHPQEDVVVKVRGRKESARTDKTGAFSLDLGKIKGTAYLEFLKTGYHPVLLAIPVEGGGQTVRVELASRDAISQIARRLGVHQQTVKGVFLGKAVGTGGKPLKGLSLQLNQKAEGPYYFTEEGFPSLSPKATTSDGRFLFLNVEPGAGFVDASLNGEAIAPFLLSTVEGGELVTKTLTPVSGNIKGRLFNPVSTQGKLLPVSGARLRVEGSADWSNTDSYGAFFVGPVRWMKGELISLEFSAERYNNHRYIMSPDAKRDALNLFAFPATYLGRLAASMDLDLDPHAGIVMGKVSGPSVRIDALAEHSTVNSAKDFYFDTQGKLRGSHTMTEPAFGTYVIFNVPKGRALLQGNDAGGVLRYSEAVVSSPASISIVMD